MKRIPREEYAELWFVNSPLAHSSWTKMEHALADYAAEHFVNRLVLSDELNEIQVMLIQERDRIKAANGRLTPVDVTYHVDRTSGLAWLSIGQVCITLFQVRKGDIHD